MGRSFEINRKVYKDIKKMDHSQMSAFCKDLYRNGYKDGQKDADGLNVNELREVLLGIKGIGEKRVDIIIQAIEERMKSE